MPLKLIPFLFFFIFSASYAQVYNFTNFSYADGLKYAEITCVNEDENGFIWLGTKEDGLIRYDGVNFKKTTPKTEIQSHFIKNITPHGDEIIFSSYDNGFFAYSKRTGKTKRIHSSIKISSKAIYFSRKDSVDFLFTETSILSSKNGKTGSLKNLSLSSVPLEIYQKITSGKDDYILTNLGGFKVNGAKISKFSSQTNHDFRTGYIENQTLILFDNKRKRFYSKNKNGEISIDKTQSIDLDIDERILSIVQSKKQKEVFALTSSNRLFKKKNGSWKQIIHNSFEPLVDCRNLFIDHNDNLWVTSKTKGVYYISNDIFTKRETDITLKKEITGIGSNSQFTFITTIDSKSYIGQLNTPNSFREIDIKANCIAIDSDIIYVGTKNGVYYYDSVKSKFIELFLQGFSVQRIGFSNNKIIACVNNKGIYTYNLTSKKQNFIPKKRSFFSIEAIEKNKLFIGTETGPYLLNLGREVLSAITSKEYDLDFKCISTDKNSKGTIWSLLENGDIIGYTQSAELSKIKKDENNIKKYLSINVDEKDNLIIGTDEGITYIQLKKNGTVKDIFSYDSSRGFNGYSCITNATYSKNNTLLIGTRNGLISVKTNRFLETKTPSKSFIQIQEEKDGKYLLLEVGGTSNEKAVFRYRLDDSDWIQEKENRIPLKYSFEKIEVQASFDGVNFGDSTYLNNSRKIQFWNSDWFVISSVIILFSLNFIFSSSYLSNQNKGPISTKSQMDFNSQGKLILFALLAAPITLTLPYFRSDNFIQQIIPELILILILIVLFGLHLTKRFIHNSLHFLHVTFFLVMLETFFRLYITDLSAYYLVGTIAVSGFLPLLSKYKIIPIIYCISIVIVSFLFTIFIKQPAYPIEQYWAGIFGCISLVLFITFIKSASTRKLEYASDIINNGTVFYVGMNNEGIVNYVTQNFLDCMGLIREEVINHHVKNLNKIIAPNHNIKDFDVLKDFADQDKYLVPTRIRQDEIIWIEWEQKTMSSDNKIMYGRDVTSTLELENTYEVLVQNSQDLIFKCDVHGNFKFCNTAFYEKLGYCKEELIDQHSLSIVQEKFKIKLKEFYAIHFQEKRKFSYLEFPIISKEGKLIWIGQYVTTIFSIGSDKHITGFIATARDITKKIENQKVIESQNKLIESNLKYARTIQKSILPSELDFQMVFKNSFIFTRQKETPSGDFYWAKEFDSRKIVILADCSNKIISGNYISLFIYNLVNAIVIEDKIYSPEAILNELDKRIESVFSNNLEIITGIKFTVCSIFEDEIIYACAGTQFIIFENQVMTICSGSKKKIAESSTDKHLYKSMNYKILGSGSVTLFSDGFHDQKGVNSDKTTFGLKRLMQLLESTSELPIKAQKSLIEKSWESWTGNQPPEKDATIISMRK